MAKLEDEGTAVSVHTLPSCSCRITNHAGVRLVILQLQDLLYNILYRKYGKSADAQCKMPSYKRTGITVEYSAKPG